MGILGSPFSHDFRDPIVSTETSFACKRQEHYDEEYDTGGYGLLLNFLGAE